MNEAELQREINELIRVHDNLKALGHKHPKNDARLLALLLEDVRRHPAAYAKKGLSL